MFHLEPNYFDIVEVVTGVGYLTIVLDIGLVRFFEYLSNTSVKQNFSITIFGAFHVSIELMQLRITNDQILT